VAFELESIDRVYLSCRYRHDKYNAAFQIMPSNLGRVRPSGDMTPPTDIVTRHNLSISTGYSRTLAADLAAGRTQVDLRGA
jgi:hypothetical protein